MTEVAKRQGAKRLRLHVQFVPKHRMFMLNMFDLPSFTNYHSTGVANFQVRHPQCVA